MKVLGGEIRKKMKIAKLVAMGLIAAFVLAGTGYAAAQNNYMSEESKNVESGMDAAERGVVKTVTLPPGISDYYLELGGCYPKDYDTFKLSVTKDCKVYFEQEDCCITGDTMCFGTGMKRKVCATSPDIATASVFVKAGKYTVYSAYTDCPGGFPAGYWMTISA